jgi:preprotein translocase subunit SecB
MDEDKQPGITIDGIILAESYFKRLPNIKEREKIDIKFNVQNKITPDNTKLVTEFQVFLNKKTDSVYGRFIFIGLFSTKKEANISLEQFANNNAPAYIFPYIREEIHNRSLKAGLPPIIIEPLNIVALTKCK